MKKLLLLLLIGVFSVVFAGIGKIDSLQGDITIKRGTEILKATKGQEIDLNDIVVTKGAGKVKLHFNDDTIISLGKDATFSVSEYYYEENKKPKAQFNMFAGAFKAVSGKIGKVAPERFTIKTKTATIGIRGTIIIGTVTPIGDTIGCSKGAISVKTPFGTVVFKAGSFTQVKPGQAPSKPQKFNNEFSQDINKDTSISQEDDSAGTNNTNPPEFGDIPEDTGGPDDSPKRRNTPKALIRTPNMDTTTASVAAAATATATAEEEAATATNEAAAQEEEATNEAAAQEEAAAAEAAAQEEAAAAEAAAQEEAAAAEAAAQEEAAAAEAAAQEEAAALAAEKEAERLAAEEEVARQIAAWEAAIQAAAETPAESSIFYKKTHTISSSSTGSVGQTFFTVEEGSTTITVATHGPSNDPEIILLKKDAAGLYSTYITEDDDGWTAAGSFSNSILSITLDAGEYLLATSDFPFNIDDATDGVNDGSSPGDITLHFSANKPIILADFDENYAGISGIGTFAFTAGVGSSFYNSYSDKKMFGVLTDSSPGTTVASHEEGIFVTVPDSSYTGFTGTEINDYSSWGYWVTDIDNSIDNSSDIVYKESAWVAGQLTNATNMADLMERADSATPSYRGHALGSVTNGFLVETILVDDNNYVAMNFNLSTELVTGSIRFNTDSTNWNEEIIDSAVLPQGFVFETGLGNQATGSGTGVFFGPNVDSVGGIFNATQGALEANAVFKATKDIAVRVRP